MVRTKSAYFSYLAIFLCSFSYVWSGVLLSASGFLSPRSKNPLADFLMLRFLNALDRVYVGARGARPKGGVDRYTPPSDPQRLMSGTEPRVSHPSERL